MAVRGRDRGVLGAARLPDRPGGASHRHPLARIPDLRETRTFDGYVVRVPWHYESDGNGNGQWEPTGYVAVDDGSSDEVRAVRCTTAGIKEGQRVRVTLTPRLRHVTHMEVVGRSS